MVYNDDNALDIKKDDNNCNKMVENCKKYYQQFQAFINFNFLIYIGCIGMLKEAEMEGSGVYEIT